MSLVPDVGYLSFARVPAERPEQREVPGVAPDVAVEILSPGDWRPLIDEKIRLYLDAGTSLVVVVDPKHRTVELHERDRSEVFGSGRCARAPSCAELVLDVDDLFADL